MFLYNDRLCKYVTEINEVRVCSQNSNEKTVDLATKLANIYVEQERDVVSYIYEKVCMIFGDMSVDSLIVKLGKPMIDIDRKVISYREHTLDRIHVLTVEFYGDFDSYGNFTIDG